MNFSDIDTLVLDFNGTIVDDIGLCVDILNKMLKMQGHPVVELETYKHIFTFPIINYYKAAGFKLKPEGDEDFDYLANIFVHDYKAGFESLSMFEDVIPFLEALKGKKKLVLLSASEQKMLESQLAHFGILKYFDAVIGIKDIYAASKLEEAKGFFVESKADPNKTLFIGDTLHDVEVAKALGAKIMLIARGHQAMDVLEKGESDFIVNSFDEAKELIEH